MTAEEFRSWDLEIRLRRAREDHERTFPQTLQLSKDDAPEDWAMSYGVYRLKKWKKERT